jgi:hypothetical protein
MLVPAKLHAWLSRPSSRDHQGRQSIGIHLGINQYGGYKVQVLRIFYLQGALRSQGCKITENCEVVDFKSEPNSVEIICKNQDGSMITYKAKGSLFNMMFVLLEMK